jgi:hypothetical protein
MPKVLTLKNGNKTLENVGSGIGNYFTKSNRFYSSPANSATLTTASLVANTLYAMPFITEIDIKIDSVKLVVTTLGATSQIKAAIYKDLNLYPDALLSDFGTQSGATTGVKTYTNGLPLDIPKGLYWLVTLSTFAVIVRGFAASGLIPILGYDTNLGTIQGLGYSIINPLGNIPLNFPTGAAIRTASPLPLLALRPY